MYLSGGYPLTKPELERLAGKHGLDPNSEFLGYEVDRQLRERGVRAELTTQTNPDGETCWYYLSVAYKPLPDIAKASLVKPLEETEKHRVLKNELGVSSKFESHLHLGRSNPIDEFVPRLGGDESLVPRHEPA